MMHHGNPLWLFVPSEYIVILGLLLGAMIQMNPTHVLKATVKASFGLLTGGGAPTSKHYIELLQMLYELMQLARKEGVLSLESHVNEPHSSTILTKYPLFMKDHHAVDFLCDTLKLFVAGVLDAHNMDELMERDIEVIHHEELEPAHLLQACGDSLPAIGIVAAVLGIILTMTKINQGPDVVGSSVASALVGTFLGVFLAYGFAAPMSGAVTASANAKHQYYQVMRHILTASVQGINPPMAVEIGRRNISLVDRPSFEELEEALREAKGG